MRKLIYITVTFIVCALLGAGYIWAGFTLAFCLFALKNTGSSILWEIPMGVLISSIAYDVFADEIAGILRILIPIAAVLFAGFYPRKLPVFFLLAAAALFLKNIYAVAFMCAALWCGVKFVFVTPACKKDCTIKRGLLQGNNFILKK